MGTSDDRLKLTFQLTAHGQELEVRVQSLAGQCRAETSLPPQDVLGRLLQYDPANIPPSALRTVGQALFRCLMTGDASKLAPVVLDEARRVNRPVHFELRFDPDQARLAQYPWETLADDHGRFLVRDGLVDLTRYITYPQPPPGLDAAFRELPILQVISQPRTLYPLAPAMLKVQRIETLMHATFEQFQHRLLIERLALWGLHFDGHGGMALQCPVCERLDSLSARVCSVCGASLSGAKQVGVLAFERDGDAEWITTEQLGSVLYNARIRLALLLACETARVGNQFVFSGLAPGLILAGVPAVVGMQYPVTDHFANRFANGFYTRLLRSNDMLDAMRTARALAIGETWYSPVLYSRHLKSAEEEEPVLPVYHTRNIDTAVPAQVRAGDGFMVRLWIRRPETRPLTEGELRKELGILTPEPINLRAAEADIKFEPVEGKSLRRGQVDVECQAPECDVYPERIPLFVDECLDAPPAIFTVRARRTGRIGLFFTVWQDGGQVACLSHSIQSLDPRERPETAIATKSCTLPTGNGLLETSATNRYAAERGGMNLLLQTGPDAGRRYELSRPSTSIGRSSSNDLVLKDAGLSRQHAVIHHVSATWTITDLDSTNGTFVNGVRITGSCPLRPGDRIDMGASLLVVEKSEARMPVAAAARPERISSTQAGRVSQVDHPPQPVKAGASPAPARQRGRSGKLGRSQWALLFSVLLVLGIVGVALPTGLLPLAPTPLPTLAIAVTATQVAIVTPTPATAQPKPSSTANATDTPRPSPTATARATVTGTPAPVLRPEAEFLGDITIPDGTIVKSGALLTKTWRFRNSGQVSWGDGVRLVFMEGVYRGFESNQMKGPDWVPVPEVFPGEIVDVSVDLVAPASPGRYRSYWRLQLGNGEWLEDLHYAEIVVR